MHMLNPHQRLLHFFASLCLALLLTACAGMGSSTTRLDSTPRIAVLFLSGISMVNATMNTQLDMETAAVGMVAYSNSVPWIAFRSLSDLAGGGDGANEMNTFFSIAADNSARVLLAFLVAWGN